ncbi:hypothetical protein GGR56DRAFT_243011 [Xylariaceae sp. FL0804]|nr:hypothetical protein GGR56DRAFT_243011 [Xylariaceae sp. FL0804]
MTTCLSVCLYVCCLPTQASVGRVNPCQARSTRVKPSWPVVAHGYAALEAGRPGMRANGPPRKHDLTRYGGQTGSWNKTENTHHVNTAPFSLSDEGSERSANSCRRPSSSQTGTARAQH